MIAVVLSTQEFVFAGDGVEKAAISGEGAGGTEIIDISAGLSEALNE